MYRNGFVTALALFYACILGRVASLDNGLALTPPMGWRSWNCYHGDVNDAKIRSVVDAVAAKARKDHEGKMVSLIDLGYAHVGVDDGWQACGTGYAPRPTDKPSFHSKDGRPLVNKTKFPNLKDLVDYGHEKGAKMGWYDNNCICMDEYTLQQDEGFANRSYAGDIALIVEAGFDGLKIDNCGDDRGLGFVARVAAINKTSPKPVLIENSNQGFGNPLMHRGKPGPPRENPGNDSAVTGYCPFNFFRTGGDIGPDFNGVLDKLRLTTPYQDLRTPVSRPGCWAYPDMLEVGNFRGPMNVTESRTHFGAWAVVSSPLILGLDVTNTALVDMVWDIISNQEAIAVNQAWAGHPGRQIQRDDTHQVWAKKLPGGEHAVLAINSGHQPVDVTVPLGLLNGHPGGANGHPGGAKCMQARDIWAHKDVSSPVCGEWSVKALPPHDSMFYRLTPTKSTTE